MVRSQDKADKLKQLGITPILGSLQDLDIIEKASSEADVVIATVRYSYYSRYPGGKYLSPFVQADCDDVPSAEATLRGLKKRFNATGKQPTLINTVSAAFRRLVVDGIQTYLHTGIRSLAQVSFQ